MCSLALSESFRLFALLGSFVCTAGSVSWLVPPFGMRQALLCAAVGSVIFGVAVGGSVLAVNHCAGVRLQAFDANANGVYEPSEQRAGFVEAEGLAFGDGGRIAFALASPVVGAVAAVLLIPLAWQFARLRRRGRMER